MRTKLVFALVAVALGSMLALGAATYTSVRTLLRESTLDQLDGLAESKKAALEVILSGWRESVALVASRTQLRVSLRDHARNPSPQAIAQMRRILEDALVSSTNLRDLAVFGADGSLVTRVAEDSALSELPAVLGVRGVEYRGARPVPGGVPRVTFVSDLSLGGEHVGYLAVELTATELADLTGHYDGLGDTGEAVVVMATIDGPVALHPVRHPTTGARTVSVAGGSADPVERALEGNEGLFWEDVVDYRGVAVWAATRAVPETGWGLVVKVDDSEEREPIRAFGQALTRMALSFSAFAILVGTILGLRFAKPIHDLAEVANEIRGGALSARATVRQEDEVGLLARTFNEMADELEERMTLLHEYRKFFDVSLDMMCIAGTDGFFKRVNPAFQAILGWSTEELLSRPFFDFVHPEDVEATERVVGKLAQGIPAVSFENRYRCADGSYKRVTWTSYPEPGTGLLYAIAREMPAREGRGG